MRLQQVYCYFSKVCSDYLYDIDASQYIMDLGKECSKYFTVSVNDSTKPQDANHRNVTTEYNLNPNKKDLGFIRTSPWRAIRVFHADTKLTILALLPTWLLY